MVHSVEVFWLLVIDPEINVRDIGEFYVLVIYIYYEASLKRGYIYILFGGNWSYKCEQTHEDADMGLKCRTMSMSQGLELFVL